MSETASPAAHSFRSVAPVIALCWLAVFFDGMDLTCSLSVLKGGDSCHGRVTVWVASCFTALRRDLRGVSRLRPSGGDDTASFEPEIASRVAVAVVHRAALAARPLPDMEGLGSVPEAADRADLRRREGPVDPGEGTAVAGGFVLQHADERRPSGVVD